MALKLGMQYRVLEFYQECSNDHLGLTLAFLRQGQIWENAWPEDFMENFEEFVQKIGICSCLIEKTYIFASKLMSMLLLWQGQICKNAFEKL